jgi:hypothetical protein
MDATKAKIGQDFIESSSLTNADAMSVEVQSIWRMFVTDRRRKTHHLKAEKMEKTEKVEKENPKGEKMDKEIH